MDSLSDPWNSRCLERFWSDLQSLVCENLLFVRSTSILILVSHNACFTWSKLSSLTHLNSFWAILIIHWQEMLLISFINSMVFTTIDFCFHYFCSSSVTLLICMEFNLFIVHLFRNITLYKANYNTNTFWPRGISKRQLEHSLLYSNSTRQWTECCGGPS